MSKKVSSPQVGASSDEFAIDFRRLGEPTRKWIGTDTAAGEGADDVYSQHVSGRVGGQNAILMQFILNPFKGLAFFDAARSNPFGRNSFSSENPVEFLAFSVGEQNDN